MRIIDNWSQKGRPLLIVITKKRCVFVNIHGGQEPSDGDPYKYGNREKFNKSIVRMNKEFLEKSVETFCRSTFYTDFDKSGEYTHKVPFLSPHTNCLPWGCTANALGAEDP